MAGDQLACSGTAKSNVFFFCIRRLPLAEHSFSVNAWFFSATSYFAGEPRFPKVFAGFRITVRLHLPRPGLQLNVPCHRSGTIDFPLVLAVWCCHRWTRRRGPHSFSTFKAETMFFQRSSEVWNNRKFLGLFFFCKCPKGLFFQYFSMFLRGRFFFLQIAGPGLFERISRHVILVLI